LAREVGRRLGTRCRVEPCTTAEFPRPAKRPAYSVLDLSKTESLIGPMTPWEVTLADVVKRLEVG
jgi:dTDP-4-dehydrorhamnose reductase